MLGSSLCDYSDLYILAKGTITVPKTGTAAAPNNRNKNMIFKNCASFTDCNREINNKDIDHIKDIDVVNPTCNFIKHGYNYSKKSENLWQYYREESFISNK